MLTLHARVDRGAMAMKGYSAFPNSPALLEPYFQIFNVIFRTFVGVGQRYSQCFYSPQVTGMIVNLGPRFNNVSTKFHYFEQKLIEFVLIRVLIFYYDLKLVLSDSRSCLSNNPRNIFNILLDFNNWPRGR